MQNTKWGKLTEKKLGEPLLWLLVYLVIFRFIVISLFSVPVDGAITLIVNQVNFSVWFSLLFVWISIAFHYCFRSLLPLSHNTNNKHLQTSIISQTPIRSKQMAKQFKSENFKNRIIKITWKWERERSIEISDRAVEHVQDGGVPQVEQQGMRRPYHQSRHGIKAWLSQFQCTWHGNCL